MLTGTRNTAMTGGGRTPRGIVIVSGILFWYPLAGVSYQFLHYLIGLQALGYDVYYIEESGGKWVYDPDLNDISGDPTGNISRIAQVLYAHGLGDRWSYSGPDGRLYGLSESRLGQVFRDADVLLNVTASQQIEEKWLSIPRRIYIESDPFPAQVKAAAGDAFTLQMLAAHDTHFTFGENVGTDRCLLPHAGITWLPTRQPVDVPHWFDANRPAGPRFTTVTTWHNKGKDLEHDGETYYWTKDREYLRFVELPRFRPGLFELAVGTDAESEALLDQNGWRHPWTSLAVSRDMATYRRYIQGSLGEFTVARDQYVRPRTGWFSDRSACYLAAGRPVITQDTGFTATLPTGTGLFAFTTLDDILAAVDAIRSDYPRHSRAAKEIADEYFAAPRVLASLMERAGL